MSNNPRALATRPQAAVIKQPKRGFKPVPVLIERGSTRDIHAILMQSSKEREDGHYRDSPTALVTQEQETQLAERFIKLTSRSQTIAGFFNYHWSKLYVMSSVCVACVVALYGIKIVGGVEVISIPHMFASAATAILGSVSALLGGHRIRKKAHTNAEMQEELISTQDIDDLTRAELAKDLEKETAERLLPEATGETREVLRSIVGATENATSAFDLLLCRRFDGDPTAQYANARIVFEEGTREQIQELLTTVDVITNQGTRDFLMLRLPENERI